MKPARPNDTVGEQNSPSTQPPRQKPGLFVDDATRRAAAIKRMGEMFPVNRGLKSVFFLMASAHRYAIDYIEQAPVIVLAATRGNTHAGPSERAFVKEQLAGMCRDGAQLRDVMRAYELPLPLRLLDGRVLSSGRATVIRRLALMNPSTLAQIIPGTRQKQNAWLQALENWCDAMAVRPDGEDNQRLLFEWAATNYPGIAHSEAKSARHMVDFVRAHANTFNPGWTLKRARVEEQDWHAELAKAKKVERTGVPFDREIDYAPLPTIWEHGGFSFVALQTGKAIHAEGAAMHHCVATYWERVANGHSRIYSIRENGNRVATLELGGDYGGRERPFRLRQLVGACNSRPTPDVSAAVGFFFEEIQSRMWATARG